MSELVRSTNKVAVALDQRPERLGSLVDNLATTAVAVRSRDTQLAASLAELSRVLRAAPPALRSLDRALPALERAGRHVGPALPIAPRAFRETAAAMRSLGRLAAPRRRARTVLALETAFRDLPILVGQLARTFPETKPLSDCLSSHVLPLFNAKVPDGALSSGRPVWQDFVHALVGLSSASQNFDGNGHNLRYQLGLGEQTLGTLPGWRADRARPDLAALAPREAGRGRSAAEPHGTLLEPAPAGPGRAQAGRAGSPRRPGAGSARPEKSLEELLEAVQKEARR